MAPLENSRFTRSLWLTFALATMLIPITAAAADRRQSTVVELFTSQGCSSCPPANANIIELSTHSNILALSYGVTYWDRLGWKDTFARPEFTERQVAYEKPLGQSGPFTPQVVVDGRANTVGNALAPLEALISESHRDNAPDVHIRGAAVSIGVGAAPAGGADIWLVRYDPRLVEVPVRRGENRGRTLHYKNVVHELALIGSWTGEAAALSLPEGERDLRSAILIQVRRGGPIVAATSD